MTIQAKRYPDFDLSDVHESTFDNAPSGGAWVEFRNAEEPGGDRGEFDRPAGGLAGALKEILHAAAQVKARAECRLSARNNAETAREQEAKAAIELVTKHKELKDFESEFEKESGLRFVD